MSKEFPMLNVDGAAPPRVPTNVPTPARCYDYLLGGKDNFEVDRRNVLTGLSYFPETLDIARQNRLFLYRVVRFLTRDAGIHQFLDMGSGLPTQLNVHQVAQRFRSDVRVVYVDNDPIVLAHGRALLSDSEHTTVITADITDPAGILAHPETTRLLDFSEPIAVLFLSVPHSLPDEEKARHSIRGALERAVPGSYLALSQISAERQEIADAINAGINAQGMLWKTRLPHEVAALVEGLEPVEPGLVDVARWHPDPDQPALGSVAEELRPFLGASEHNENVREFGGLLRKPE